MRERIGVFLVSMGHFQPFRQCLYLLYPWMDLLSEVATVVGVKVEVEEVPVFQLVGEVAAVEEVVEVSDRPPEAEEAVMALALTT